MKRIHVAAGVIWDDALSRVLVSKRLANAHQGGLWEFPGGKVEADKSVLEALTRELLEEVNITVIQASPLIQVSHDYTDKKVLLDVWLVSKFEGLAQGREGQALRWVNQEELNTLIFPAANEAIVELVTQLFD